MQVYRREGDGTEWSGPRQWEGRAGAGKASVVLPFGWQETFKLVQLLLKPQPWGYFLPPAAFLLGAKGATHHFDQRRSMDKGGCKMYESFRNRSQPWLPVKAMT